MSTSRRIAFGAAAQWVSRVVSILLGLILIPVLMRNLPKEEVGLWLLLGQSWGVMGILDLGFGVTFTRRIAMAKGKGGGDIMAPLTEASISEIEDLMVSGQRVYRWMAFAVFIVALVSGFYYLADLKLVVSPVTVVWTAWAILCGCQALTVWQSVWICLVQGKGYVGWDALLSSAINCGTIVLQIAAVLLGGGIISLAVIATIGVVIQRLWLISFIKHQSPELQMNRGKWNPEVLKGVPSLALRAWLSSLGTVMVFNTDSFFIASLEGAGNIPAYRAAFLVALNLHVLSGVFVQSSSVFLSHLWQSGDLAEVHRIFQRNLKLGWCIIACGGAAVFATGDSLFNVWLGNGNYVGEVVVSLLLFTFLLEQQSFIIVTSCRATDSEPFSLALLMSGVLKLALAIPLIHWGGLVGIALATLVGQASFAYRSVLWNGLHRLNFPIHLYFKTVILPGLIVLAIALLACSAGTHFIQGATDFVKVSIVSLTAGGVLTVSVWYVVLAKGERQRLLSYIGVK